WSCEGTAELQLFHMDEEEKNITRRFDFRFDCKNNRGGFESFYSLDDMDTYYFDYDCIHIGAKIAIRNVNGIRETPKFDFSSPSAFSDVTFIVEGKKIHAHKKYLSAYSKILHKALFVDENTKNLSEFELPGVKYEEFIDLLQCIYPSFKKV
ncbi:hypothetical protein PFISCL1PPCAC_22292, partial [Pristionchus fissidentatus]